ncbi:hypothetical protein [uncultured Gimesia sp.]|uniref:hypothetical protein n=1 Tax=uncultured Gimesia sp. TaxID=1678688 RepID=UPI00262FD6A1|nr:hypothetical protein [uncultured Gimesia sp.]
MNDLLFYLPSTADNLLFLTLAVLVLLMITGIYGYLSTQLKPGGGTRPKLQWGWPVLSLIALLALFYWFGQPLSKNSVGDLRELKILISPFLTGFIVIGAGAAAVLSSNLRWALAAATVSFLTSGLLFLQAEVLPLVLLCWLILGGSVLLFLYQGISENGLHVNNKNSQEPFREPFLSCLACGFLLCGCLWVVHREWSSKLTETTTIKEVAVFEGLSLVRQFLNEHWPTFILLMVFVAVSFVGISRLIVDQKKEH